MFETFGVNGYGRVYRVKAGGRIATLYVGERLDPYGPARGWAWFVLPFRRWEVRFILRREEV